MIDPSLLLGGCDTWEEAKRAASRLNSARSLALKMLSR